MFITKNNAFYIIRIFVWGMMSFCYTSALKIYMNDEKTGPTQLHISKCISQRKNVNKMQH